MVFCDGLINLIETKNIIEIYCGHTFTFKYKKCDARRNKLTRYHSLMNYLLLKALVPCLFMEPILDYFCILLAYSWVEV